jgi:hypothetical protein
MKRGQLIECVKRKTRLVSNVTLSIIALNRIFDPIQSNFIWSDSEVLVYSCITAWSDSAKMVGDQVWFHIQCVNWVASTLESPTSS